MPVATIAKAKVASAERLLAPSSKFAPASRNRCRTPDAMAEDYLASRGGDKLLADIPLGRVADPEEVAKLARFCALEAPPSMTGAVLDINGASYVR